MDYIEYPDGVQWSPESLAKHRLPDGAEELMLSFVPGLAETYKMWVKVSSQRAVNAADLESELDEYETPYDEDEQRKQYRERLAIVEQTTGELRDWNERLRDISMGAGEAVLALEQGSISTLELAGRIADWNRGLMALRERIARVRLEAAEVEVMRDYLRNRMIEKFGEFVQLATVPRGERIPNIEKYQVYE